ncbi:MAG: hypothetical protein QXG44_06010 [Candidatus Jordarchaeaceae archaeon]
MVNKPNSKSLEVWGNIRNKASLLFIIGVIAYIIVLLIVPWMLLSLPKSPYPLVFFIDYLSRLEFASVLRLLFVLVTVPLPLLFFYASIYNQVSYRHKNYGKVWSLIRTVIKQNWRKEARFILTPALYITMGVLLVCYGFMRVEYLFNEYTWGNYIPLIVFWTAIALAVLSHVLGKVIVREIERLS